MVGIVCRGVPFGNQAGPGEPSPLAAPFPSLGWALTSPTACSAGNFDSGLDEERAVTAAEVGIRPCFYWLDAEVSEEERMFAEANARWLKSDCQDDVVVMDSFGGLANHMFVGVFDGHGPYGRNAAKLASARIPAVLASKGSLAGLSDRRWMRLLRDACTEVNASMQDPREGGLDASLSGTTACFAVVAGRKVHIASAGDSRCFVARRTLSGAVEAVQLTEDAKPENPEEMRRIHYSGGWWGGMWVGLAVGSSCAPGWHHGCFCWGGHVAEQQAVAARQLFV